MFRELQFELLKKPANHSGIIPIVLSHVSTN